VELACLDLEGVLVPEIWIAFAERTGIEELKATTRDIPDYNVLMRQRLEILAANNLTINGLTTGGKYTPSRRSNFRQITFFQKDKAIGDLA